MVIGLIGVVCVLAIAPKVPSDQTVHVVLGRGAERVRELHILYFGPLSEKEAAEDAETVASSGNFAREATFRYGQGVHAPRIVDHTPRLVNGDYIVEVSLAADAASPKGADPKGADLQRAQIARHVHLAGSDRAASIDVAEAISP